MRAGSLRRKVPDAACRGPICREVGHSAVHYNIDRKKFEKNPALHTAPKTNVNQANCALYFNDLGFSKTKLMIFSTFSKWSDGGLITNAYRFR